jgi:hypothetical protein
MAFFRAKSSPALRGDEAHDSGSDPLVRRDGVALDRVSSSGKLQHVTARLDVPLLLFTIGVPASKGTSSHIGRRLLHVANIQLT